MLTAILLNKEVNIAEDKAQEYARLGYTVMNGSGEVVAEPEISTTEGARAKIKKLQEEIEDKDAAIATLQAEIAQLKGKKTGTKKAAAAE